MNKPMVLSLLPASTAASTPATTELFINAAIPQEIRIAYLEGGILQEIHIEQSDQRSMVGNIYRGRIRRVLPGLQAAFIDIGAERLAFLRTADILPGASTRSTAFQAGQSLTVQVIKDPRETKGAQLTTRLTLVGRYLVLMPHRHDIRISPRISQPADRQRLAALIPTLNACPPGFMLRTAAITAGAAVLVQEADLLKQRWQTMVEQASHTNGPTLLYRAASMMQRTVRDLANETLSRIVVDCQATYQDLTAFTQLAIGALADKLILYQEAQPIFQRFNIEQAIQQALSPRVSLPSGGYLLIEQTNALTAIDVNTGQFTGHNHASAVILQTNLEAAVTIARQLRLRNLGGIIIIDFIDMRYRAHQQQVLTTFQQALAKDRVKTTLGSFSPLGILEMTRHRNRDSLEKIVCSDCPTCHGRGTVKTLQTICQEILREILRLHCQYAAAQQFLVHSSPTIHEALKNSHNHVLILAATTTGKSIRLTVEPYYQHEQFKIVMPTD